MKKISKNAAFISAAFLTVFIFSGCDKKAEEAQRQTGNSGEVQSKLDEQQAKIDELQSYKNEQQKVAEEKNQQDEQGKKEKCQKDLKWAQDRLAGTQRQLGEDQKVLDTAIADKCNDCYSKCMKSHGCSKSSCENPVMNDFDKIKKECKKKHEENIGFRKDDVNGDKKAVAEAEKNLSNIKVECGL